MRRRRRPIDRQQRHGARETTARRVGGAAAERRADGREPAALQPLRRLIRRGPLCPLAVVWILACWLGAGSVDRPEVGTWTLAISIGLAIAAAAHRRRRPLLALALVFAIVFATGLAYGVTAALPPEASRLADHRRGLQGPWRVHGRLHTSPVRNGPRWTVDLAVDEVFVDGAWKRWPLRVRTTVYSGDPSRDWTNGDGFETFLRLRPDRPARNPHVAARPPLRASGADVRSSLKSFRQLRRRPEVATTVNRWIAKARASVRRTVDARFPARAPWVNALLLGERGDIPSASIAVLARTGLIHVMAISGLHVGIAVATLFNALRLSGLARPRTAAICLAALPALHAFVVPRPAVDRASLMAAVVLSGIVLGRRTSAFHGLALATVLLTLRDPLVTGDTGFQLSTAATAAILSVGMNGAAPNFIGRFVIGSFVVSCAAQAGVAPLLAAANHRLPLAAVPLNLVAVPAVGIAIVAAAVAVGADLVGVEHAARALAVVAGTALDTLAGVAAAVDAPGRALIVPAAVVGWMLPSALVAIGALALSVRVAARTPNGSAALLGVGLSLALLAAPAATARLIVAGDRPGPGDFRLVALDVGQGDALLVETHDQRVLVDTGGSPASNFDPGTALIAPALRARGAGSLDAVAITHFHADHAGGLRGVLAEIPTRRVWVPSSALDDASLRDSSGGGDKTRIVGLARGDAGFHGDCAWRVLHPAGGWLVAGGAPASNDGSLVMMLSCGGRRLLLTGDTEVAAESDYVSSGAGLRAQVLKSPHHGSTTSSSDMLLDAADARIAVISVGWRNRFGHPGRAVLENYRSRRMAVYRTDRDGAVTIDAGRRIRVRGERWSAGRGRPRTGGWLH